MTSPTITGGIRISPQLWAEFGLVARADGKTRNAARVDMIRDRVVRARRDTTTHSAKEEGA